MYPIHAVSARYCFVPEIGQRHAGEKVQKGPRNEICNDDEADNYGNVPKPLAWEYAEVEEKDRELDG